MALLAVETANGFNGRPRAAGRTMPVECMSGKSAFLAAIAWFAAHLLTNHVSQHPKAFFRPPFFRFVEMVVHQLMEDAHGRVAFQLPGDVVLRRFDAFPLLEDLRQHQFGGRPGVSLL